MRHFINGQEITPRNRESIGVISDFSGDPNVLSLNVDSVILPLEAFDIVKQHISNVGLFEGLPYEVVVDGITLNYYIDLIDDVKVRQHEIEVKLKRRKKIDAFRERIDGLSFETMVKNGVNFQSYNVPYFIVKDNQAEVALQLSIATYIMTKELIQAVKDLSTAIADVVNASIPILIPIPIPNTGAIIQASLKAVAQLIYTSAVLIAVIKLANQMIQLVFPPLRNLKGTSFNELMRKSCAYLGYQYESATIDDKWVLCPVPLTKERDSIFDNVAQALVGSSFNNGYPSASDTTPTLGSFIDALETMFNARTFIIGNVVRIERRDFLQNLASTQLMPSLSIQGNRDDEFTYLSGDSWKRYYLHYQTDFADLHTLDAKVYDAHNAEYSTEPSFAITNQDLVLIKGLQDVNIPFALAKRKEKLNWLEQTGKGFFTLIDAVTGVFGGGTSFASQINERKNAMQVSQEYFGVSKALYAKLNEFKVGAYVQADDYMNYASATALWDKYHYINAINKNDYILKENVRVMLTHQDFVTLQDINWAEINGVICEILKIEWIDEKSFAQITYKERTNWANGKVNVIKIN